MKRWIKIWSVALLTSSLVVTACLPDPLEVDGIPVVKEEIVVSTQIIPDQSLVVLLTKTFDALEQVEDSISQELLDEILISDAVVTITGPQGSDTLFSLGNGAYGGTFIEFEAGQEYTLRVKSESMGEVTAKTTVKRQITFDDIEADLYYNGFDDTLAQITHQINDPQEKNYYMINVQEVESEDVVENFINPRAFTRLIDDTDFNGKTYGEVFRVVPRDYSPGDTIAVTLSNINKDYYDFVKLRLDNRFSFVEFLGEPINYPSNVEGGKGFFNLYIPDIRVFILE